MDAVVCIKEKARMCGRDCAISVFTECVGCESWIELHPEEAVRIIEEWSKAHPIQTNGMKLKKDFSLPSVEKVFNAGRWMYALPEEWWNAPYEAPKGE